MRFVLGFVGLLGLCACSDLAGPNTDVGLRVWAEVSPTTVSISDTTAALRIRVYVTNPSSKEIRIVSGGPPYRFTGDPIQSQGLWGSMRIGNDSDPLHAGPSVNWWGDSLYVFPPREGEYSEYILTLKEWQARGWPLLSGRYRVRSWFNAREGSSAEFVITP